MDYSEDIKERIEARDKLNKEIDALSKEQKKFEVQSDDIKLATKIHDKLCNSNHTDGCSWGYESWDDIGKENRSHTKKRYLDKAKAILRVTDYDTACKVVGLLSAY